MILERFITDSSGTAFLFFAGKGGVGKSTMSCATALFAAQQGKRVLIVTTDAAPNLADIFEQKIGNTITPISGLENLSAIEIDPEDAAQAYRAKAAEQFRKQFSGKRLESILEELKSPCVEEVATLNEFSSYLDRTDFDLIIFDTAPTGHTLRLLELPGSWSMELSKEGYTCIGPNDALQDERLTYERIAGVLTDENRTRFVFVTKPESLSIKETERSIGELRRIGIEAHTIIVNGLLPPIDALSTERAVQLEAIEQLKQEHTTIEQLVYPLSRAEIRGKEGLETTARTLFSQSFPDELEGSFEQVTPIRHLFSEDLEGVLKPNTGSRYVFFMGKGGVGKSTVASISAVRMARQGYTTLLVTTDPANHLSAIFEIEASDTPTSVGEKLFVANIDPVRAHAQYKERKLSEILDRIKANTSIRVDVEATERKIREQLDSPCAQEVAYFEAFMSYFEMPEYEIVVFDTAPTGHTLRMLELPSEWNDFVEAAAGLTSSENRYAQIIDLMRNEDRSSFVFVTLAEYTPMMEAYRASEELRRFVGARVALVVVNNTIQEPSDDAFVNARIEQQNTYVARIAERFDAPIVTIPRFGSEPIGSDKLREAVERVFTGDHN